MKGVRSFMGVLGLLALILLFPFSALAEPVGKFTAVEGKVDITSPGEEARPAQVGDEISVGDIVRSKSKSKAEITFHDGNILRFAQNTRVKISEYKVGEEGSRGILKLFRGKIQSIVNRVLGGTFGRKKKYIFEVHTPSAVCGVRGTNFFTWYEWGASYVAFKEGQGYVFPLNREDLMTLINKGEGARVLSPYKPLEKYPLPDERLDELEEDTAPEEEAKGDSAGKEKSFSPDELESDAEILVGQRGHYSQQWLKSTTNMDMEGVDPTLNQDTPIPFAGRVLSLLKSAEDTDKSSLAEPEKLSISYRGVGWPHGEFGTRGWGYILLEDSSGEQISQQGQMEGTWGFEASGSYGRYTWSDNWSLHLHNSAQDPEIHRWAEVVGSKWSGTVINGKVAGAWVNLEDAMTGVTGGALEGSYNPTQNTWQSLAKGNWMETRRFLQMAATTYDYTSDSYTFNTTGTGLSETQEKLLHDHNIPCIEIGRADLTGSNNFQDGSMSITMQDVTFFAYSTGSTPKIWATHKVTGNYSGTPQQGWTINDMQGVNRQNVRYLDAHFVVEKWDQGNGKWGGEIRNGDGKVGAHYIHFKGGAAGTIDSANAFSGTGAGVVTPK